MLITDATNLPRLMNCNGSRLMAAVLPPDSNQAARDEGNAADWLAQQWFKGVTISEGTKAPNGYAITTEMIDHVGTYIKALDCGEMQPVTTFETERWQVNARADHIKYNPPQHLPGNVLTVDDLKYGHRIVEPFENWTLLAHAIGYCIRHQITPALIILRIHQPRPYHPDGKCREWRLTYAELMEYYKRIDAVLSNPSDMLNTGPHCYRCHAAPSCPAYRMSSMNGVEASTLAYNDDLTPAVLAYELDLLRAAKSRIDGRVDALQELAAHQMRKGIVIPDYALEPQYAHTRWKPGISPQALSLASGIDCTKPGAITPKEFKRRGGSDAAYETLTERPLTGTKVVRVDATTRARRLLGR